MKLLILSTLCLTAHMALGRQSTSDQLGSLVANNAASLGATSAKADSSVIISYRSDKPQITQGKSASKPFSRSLTYRLEAGKWTLNVRYDFTQNGIKQRIERTLDITNTTDNEREQRLADLEKELMLPAKEN